MPPSPLFKKDYITVPLLPAGPGFGVVYAFCHTLSLVGTVLRFSYNPFPLSLSIVKHIEKRPAHDPMIHGESGPRTVFFLPA